MTIEMEHAPIRHQIIIAYSDLRSKFINVSKPHLTASDLNSLKTKYSDVINSVRTSDYINSIEGLLRTLEKRGVLSYDNINVLKYISKTYVRDYVLEKTLQNYEGQSRPLLPPHNRYLVQSVRHKICSRYGIGAMGAFLWATLLVVSIYMCSVPSVELPASAPPFEAQPSASRPAAFYNASQLYGQPIRMTLYSTQPAFQITLPGSIDIGPTNQSPTNNESEAMRKVFEEVSEKLGRHWRNVARYLRVTEYDIDEIDHQFNLSLNEKALKALLKFQSKCDPLRLKEKLKYALNKARRRDLMELVDDLLSRK